MDTKPDRAKDGAGRRRLSSVATAIELLKGRVGDDPSLAVLLSKAYYKDGDPVNAAAVLEPFARNLLAGEPSSFSWYVLLNGQPATVSQLRRVVTIKPVLDFHALQPGDILATGTNHRGLNPFMDGDKIELTCEGCGTLHITVRDDLKRTWSRITRLQHKQSGAEGVHTRQTGGKYAPAK